MNSIINAMAKYDHRQHELSDWLSELEQRFQLGEVDTDKSKIIWCQLLIGATGNSILAGLEEDTTWNTAKETLLSRLGAGSVRDEAWVALKNLTKGTKEIVELAEEAEKLAKRLHPQDAEAVERHAVDAFLGALDRSLAAEVKKLGHTQMKGVVADARRIEKILQEQPTPATDSAIEAMNRQIQILKKDLVKANEHLVAQSTTPPQTASLALSASPTVTVAQPPPATFIPQPKSQALVFPPQQPMPPPPPQYVQDYPASYRQEDPPYYRQQDRQAAGCFLCGEAEHLAYRCPARTLLQQLLRQQTPEQVRQSPPDQVIKLPPTNGSPSAPPVQLNLTEESPGAKVAPVRCAVAPPISGLLQIEGIPVEGLVDTGASVTCLGFAIWWRYRAQWGSLEPFTHPVRGAHGKPLSIAGKTQYLDIQWGEARGRASFIIIVGLESPPCLIGMDIMRPLRVRIDVTEGTATPAQPDPQLIHLNAAQTQPPQKKPLPGPTSALPPAQEAANQGASLPLPKAYAASPPLPVQPGRLPATGEVVAPSPAASQPAPPPGFSPAYTNLAHPHIASCARLLQTADIPPETARLVRCHNPWPSEDVLFCPDGALPAFVTGIPALSSGPELWYAVHNHRPEPLQLHAGQSIGVLEVVQLAEAPAPAPPSSSHPTSSPCQPPLPENLSPLQQQQLNELFKEYIDVFSQGDEDLGNTPLLEHGIETHGPPLRQPYRRQNPAVRREEMTQVQQMLSSNVIRPSNSPWASPVVMVRKKDGSLRFCVDFRQLNAATVKDAHPLPRIDDLLDALHGAKWFSTLDLKSGYWQVPIAEQDKEKTAFRTSSGQLFEFNQVPFGLCNAPATFSRLMDRVLAGLHWETCLFYLDDIIVFSSTWEEHLARLREVFERLRQAKLKLGAAKCTFAAKEVSYLGHRVTEEGLLPDPSLLAAIRDIPPPTTATEVRSFLGLAGYYRRYVKGFAAIAAPLFALTRKEALFHWSEDCQAAFDQLKNRLTTSPITAFPDFSQAFRLYTDASTAGLGAILAQVREGKERIICCASRALNKAEKSYPATKLECLAIVWAVAKFRPYLMAMPFEVYTDHYALQWLKTMRTGSALLHRWSAALEEYDFTVRHRPGKVQTHVDGLSRLPVGPAPPDDTLLHIEVSDEEEARRLAQELHSATHLGGQALWRLFSDRYSHKAGRRICIEVAQSCPQCQRGSDYGHHQKTTGTIESKGPWDTLSVDIVGPLPADSRHEFIIVFVDCYSRFTVLVPASNHTADTVSEALLRHVVPYFGTPRRLLSDRGREFVSEVWQKLTTTLGIQRVLTSPYHPEGNSINERSHRTMNNMLRARLLKDLPSRKWVAEIPGIMLALNAMVHEPHGFSASMIATGREPSLPPDVDNEACASPSTADPVAYVDMVRQRLALTHQQMTSPPAPETHSPYHEGDLIFVMTTPPERTNKLTPRWKGPFEVKRVPNTYQVTYEDGMVWRTVHVNHVKPAKAPPGGFPVPTAPPASDIPPQRYSSRNLSWRKPPPPQPATLTRGSPPPATPVAAPTRPVTARRPIAHPPSRPITRSLTGHQLASRSEPRLPATPAQAQPGQSPRRSARIKARVCTVESHPQPAAPQLLRYEQCIGCREGPHSFCSLVLKDLRTGHSEYLSDTQQLIDALPRSLDPGSRLTLIAQVAPPGQRCLPPAMRASLRWLLPSDGEFQSGPDGQSYYLARQGRRVVLRGGDVKAPLANSRINWVCDSPPSQSPHIAPRQTLLENKNPKKRTSNSVPRNVYPPPRKESSAISIAPSSDVRVRAPFTRIESSTWENSSRKICPPVPRNNMTDSDRHTVPPPQKRKRNRVNRRERRAREREERALIEEAFNHDARWNFQSPGALSSTTIPDRLTTIGLPHSEPISAMRPAVYLPVTEQGRPGTNENSSSLFGQELCESVGLPPGLYKAPDPDPQHHNWNSTWASSSEDDPPSPTRPPWACSLGARPRIGIIYPLQPRQRRPDTCITVEAVSRPEPAALHREELPVCEVPTDLPRPSQRPGRKRRRKRSSALYRPAKRSPPRGRWCIL